MKTIDSVLKLLFVIGTIFMSSLLASSTQKPLDKKVSVQLSWKHQFEYAGFYIAKEKGYYQKFGLDVALKEYTNNVQVIEDLQSAKTTFALIVPTIIQDIANGEEITILSAILQSSPHAFVSLESSNINSISDFKNKKIMTKEDVLDSAQFLGMLKKNDVSVNEIEMIPTSFNVDDLINHKADLMSIFLTNEPYELLNKGVKYKIWDPRDFGFDFYDDLLITSNKTLKNDPMMVQHFNEATKKGYEYAFDNIDETVELILQKYNTQKKTKKQLLFEANELKKLAFFNTDRFGEVDGEKIKKIFDVYDILGLVDQPLDLQKAIYNSNANFELNEKELQYLKTKKTYKVCNRYDYYPLSGYKNGKLVGISGDLFALIGEKLHINFEVVNADSDEQFYENVTSNRCDLISVINQGFNGFKNFTTTDSTFVTQKFVAIGTIDLPYQQHLELSEESVFYVKETIHKNIIQKIYPNLTVIINSDIDEIFEIISTRKNNYFVVPNIVADQFINKYGFDKFKTVYKFDLIEVSSSIGVNTSTALPMVEILNKTILSIGANKLKEIQNNYKVTQYTLIQYEWLWYVAFVLMAIISIIQYIYTSKIRHQQHKENILKADLLEAQRITKTGSFTHIIKDNIFETSPQYRINHGFNPNKEISIEELTSSVHPKDREYFLNKIQEAHKSFQVFYITYRVLIQGQVRYLEANWSFEVDKNKTLLKVTGATRDITKEVIAQQIKVENSENAKNTQDGAKFVVELPLL